MPERNRERDDRGRPTDLQDYPWRLRADVQGRGPNHSYFASRHAALSAAISLWKRGLVPIEIIGPEGEIVSREEIEAYQAAELNRESEN
jgi:hypothetical protein